MRLGDHDHWGLPIPSRIKGSTISI